MCVVGLRLRLWRLLPTPPCECLFFLKVVARGLYALWHIWTNASLYLAPADFAVAVTAAEAAAVLRVACPQQGETHCGAHACFNLVSRMTDRAPMGLNVSCCLFHAVIACVARCVVEHYVRFAVQCHGQVMRRRMALYNTMRESSAAAALREDDLVTSLVMHPAQATLTASLSATGSHRQDTTVGTSSLIQAAAAPILERCVRGVPATAAAAATSTAQLRNGARGRQQPPAPTAVPSHTVSAFPRGAARGLGIVPYNDADYDSPTQMPDLASGKASHLTAYFQVSSG